MTPTLRARRNFSAVLLAAAGCAALVLWRLTPGWLWRPAYATGWPLLLLLAGLALYGVRKKLPFLPIGNASAWLQLHLYAGAFAVLLYLMHTRARVVPSGPLETLLAILFAITALSGVVGIAFDRVYPRMLRTRGEPILRSRIPKLRREVAARADELVLQAATETGDHALAEFHLSRLKPFFDHPRNRTEHLVGSRLPLQNRLREMESIHRYLSEGERTAAKALVDLVKQKDLLDLNDSVQGALRAWLFVHVPATAALLVFAAVHTLLVHAF